MQESGVVAGPHSAAVTTSRVPCRLRHSKSRSLQESTRQEVQTLVGVPRLLLRLCVWGPAYSFLGQEPKHRPRDHRRSVKSFGLLFSV